MLSSQAKYALRALMYLTQRSPGEFVRVEEIASRTNTPAPYLSKLFKELVQSGLVESRRGAKGGVRLRSSGEITFYEVCEALGDPVVKDECVLFKRACNRAHPCPFHHDWSATKSRFLEFLKSKTIA